MFCFEVEGQEFGMKPMNCPGHCLMFKHDVRSLEGFTDEICGLWRPNIAMN